MTQTVAERAAGCVFCQIVGGDIPAKVVLDTDDVMAFHDIAPKAEVHVLVLPKRHLPDVTSLTAEPPLLAAVVSAAGRVAADLTANGHFRLIFNTGAEAGQTVFHAHGHILAGGGPAMGGL